MPQRGERGGGVMDICRCCGRPGRLARVDGGDMHLDCWLEHHSDPTGAWPPNHECTHDLAPAGVSAATTSRDSHFEDPAGAAQTSSGTTETENRS